MEMRRAGDGGAGMDARRSGRTAEAKASRTRNEADEAANWGVDPFHEPV